MDKHTGKKLSISFSDLVHTGHSCKAIPYGLAIVAAFALQHLGQKIDIELFKDTDNFIEYLSRKIPQIACFSNFIWNTKLSYEFARRIKKESPQTIIVFGGPNYPLELGKQQEFLLAHPEIDFYIYREGELAFVELFNSLVEYNLDAAKIKQARLNIPNCHYINEAELVKGPLLPPLADLEQIPSPYLTGLCDKFLKKELIPLIQTVRGCPFKCTYCQNADDYFNRVRRFSIQRIKDEIEYIAQRTTVPNLMLADVNFGMYRQDLEICRQLALIQKKYNWPKYFIGLDGKNQKERILQAASIVRGSHLTAAVQSTDEQVLKSIKRENVSLSQMLQVAKQGEVLGANIFSEIILGLPGDRKEAHFQSNLDLIDAGINVVRSHQFIMLPGAQASTKSSRQEYGMSTRFRTAPHTVKPYRLYGQTFFAPEIDEICVANKTMSFEDYLECRQFNLTVELFYNDNIFEELLKFLKFHNISASSFIMQIDKQIRSADSPLLDLYDNFLRETKELWESQEELKAFLETPGIIERYLSGELGNNEQLIYRAIAIFKQMDQLHEIAFNTAQELLGQKHSFSEQDSDYLRELAEFSLLRKKNIFSVVPIAKRQFHYDFVNLAASNFNVNPLSCCRPKGIEIIFVHTPQQQELIAKYIKIYGLSNYGLGDILSNASCISSFYRRVKRV